MMKETCKLSELPLTVRATVAGFDEKNALTERLRQLGIDEGETITPLFRSPFGDPTAYAVKDCLIALRKTDCSRVTVVTTGETDV